MLSEKVKGKNSLHNPFAPSSLGHPHLCASIQPWCISSCMHEGLPETTHPGWTSCKRGAKQAACGHPDLLHPCHSHPDPFTICHQHVRVTWPCHHKFMRDWSSAYGMVWGKATFTNNIFVLYISGCCSHCKELWWQEMDAQKKSR